MSLSVKYNPTTLIRVAFLVAILGQVRTNATAETVDSLSSFDTPTSLFLPLILVPPEPNPTPLPFGPQHTGDGTWYDADGGGNCTFPPSPDNLLVAAINHVDYADAALCGAYVQITGPDGAVIVRIVDQCPGCAAGDIDLSYEAFGQIADPQLGRVPIHWQLVSYPLPTPIVYHFKDGSNQWWTAVQIRNHTNPISKVEYRDADGIFHEIERQSYNYFVQHTPGLGVGPYTFRVTDYFGHTLLDEGVPHVENENVAGSGQFPQP